MQYRAMRYVTWKKRLCCRKKKDRRIGSKQVRTEEKRMIDDEIREFSMRRVKSLRNRHR